MQIEWRDRLRGSRELWIPICVYVCVIDRLMGMYDEGSKRWEDYVKKNVRSKLSSSSSSLCPFYDTPERSSHSIRLLTSTSTEIQQTTRSSISTHSLAIRPTAFFKNRKF